ncbi:tRNA lysidine(34) synthetase TilS [Qingshengfaniella alkalisoli]|uniref:tRNA(Ile)-lysidine synthase n=1 Tax=Qingshengfaniella alkalisoli TaxID=2599296 RepID=A0A5B8I988_9RHOB|nr:tRNA lysidine(34) synthetase TilS [Qingshengfaniella alkalisoli]QDY69526.1 tRNA lysidine(34) synthetase TilS [Qingshengfaniella alkalisoli]
MADRFAQAMQRCLAGSSPAALGVAVSGGSDSTALLILAKDWARRNGVGLYAATVDHRLRTESAQEAVQVAALCAELGLPHETLEWDRAEGGSNLQARAREARYALLADWAVAHRLDSVMIGHTQDDQAETFLLRLARGSGVDGLAAMSERRDGGLGVMWLRPLLGISRAELRDDLTARGVDWLDDPSNNNPHFDRIKMRSSMPELAKLGLDTATLSQTAERMSLAREALSYMANSVAERIAEVHLGDVVFDAAQLMVQPAEIRWRLLSGALKLVSDTSYRPRLSTLREIEAGLTAGKRATLHGCVLSPGKTWRITREAAAAPDARVVPEAIWDGRWRISGPLERIEVKPVGEVGLADFPGLASFWATASFGNRNACSLER